MVPCVKVQEWTGTIISIYQTADFLLFAYLKTSQHNRISHINTFILKLLLYIHVHIHMNDNFCLTFKIIVWVEMLQTLSLVVLQ